MWEGGGSTKLGHIEKPPIDYGSLRAVFRARNFVLICLVAQLRRRLKYVAVLHSNQCWVLGKKFTFKSLKNEF